MGAEEVTPMGRTMMIRIDGGISDEMAHAFSQSSLRSSVVEIVTLPG